jgi:mannose-6-phosphate isomerase class I
MEGSFDIISNGSKTSVTKGETVLIPANVHEVELKPQEEVTLLEVFVS